MELDLGRCHRHLTRNRWSIWTTHLDTHEACGKGRLRLRDGFADADP